MAQFFSKDTVGTTVFRALVAGLDVIEGRNCMKAMWCVLGACLFLLGCGAPLPTLGASDPTPVKAESKDEPRVKASDAQTLSEYKKKKRGGIAGLAMNLRNPIDNSKAKLCSNGDPVLSHFGKFYEPGGKWMLTYASSSERNPNHLKLWSLKDGSVIFDLCVLNEKLHNIQPVGVGVDGSGKFIFVYDHNGKICVFESSSGKLIHVFESEIGLSAFFRQSPKENCVVMSSPFARRFEHVCLREEELVVENLKGVNGGFLKLIYASDGSVLGVRDGEVCVSDAAELNFEKCYGVDGGKRGYSFHDGHIVFFQRTEDKYAFGEYSVFNLVNGTWRALGLRYSNETFYRDWLVSNEGDKLELWNWKDDRERFVVDFAAAGKRPNLGLSRIHFSHEPLGVWMCGPNGLYSAHEKDGWKAVSRGECGEDVSRFRVLKNGKVLFFLKDGSFRLEER